MTTKAQSFSEAAWLLVLGIAGAVWRAFVFTKLWQWFVSPLGVFEIGIAHALGLMLVIGLLRYKYEETKTVPTSDSLKRAGAAVFITTLALLLGWALAGMMP